MYRNKDNSMVESKSRRYYNVINNISKEKFCNETKKKIINIVTICFWGYIGIYLIFALKEVFLDSDWNEMSKQYSTLEIIIMYG